MARPQPAEVSRDKGNGAAILPVTLASKASLRVNDRPDSAASLLRVTQGPAHSGLTEEGVTDLVQETGLKRNKCFNFAKTRLTRPPCRY